MHVLQALLQRSNASTLRGFLRETPNRTCSSLRRKIPGCIISLQTITTPISYLPLFSPHSRRREIPGWINFHQTTIALISHLPLFSPHSRRRKILG
jgi:hypothetical protein